MAMTIGEVARHAGVKVETVRYYERQGLVPAPARTAAGYRQYAADTVRRIRFIRRAKALGFTLAEIRELLALRAAPGVSCGDVRDQAEAKIAEIESRLRDLQRMKVALARLARECGDGRSTSACPILEALESDGSDDESDSGVGV